MDQEKATQAIYLTYKHKDISIDNANVLFIKENVFLLVRLDLSSLYAIINTIYNGNEMLSVHIFSMFHLLCAEYIKSYSKSYRNYSAFSKCSVVRDEKLLIEERKRFLIQS